MHCNMSLGNFISHVTYFSTLDDHGLLLSIIYSLFLFGGFPFSLIVHGLGCVLSCSVMSNS